jgi:microsomal epoxide hydrolase
LSAFEHRGHYERRSDMELEARPFTLSIEASVLADLRSRLRNTRWPSVFEGHGWTYGANYDTLRMLQTYWSEEYDWRAVEAHLNGYDQFLMEVDGLDIHYFHIRSGQAEAKPLLLLHGWPGSQAEFLDLIPLLFDRVGTAPPLDLVIPAIPGFGFGGKPLCAGWGPDRIAAAFNRLMTDGLGYETYGIQGGDWGTILGRRIAQSYPERVAALHINMPYAYRPAGADDDPKLQDFHRSGLAYLNLQSTRPDAIAPGLADSPMGLATWILEKFASWSGGRGALPSTISIDHLLTNIMFYWLPNSAASAARIYYESAKEECAPFGGPPVLVPTGVAAFAHEPYRAPREWIEQAYNVVHWKDFPTGGHFAALENTADLAGDICEFFDVRGWS